MLASRAAARLARPFSPALIVINVFNLLQRTLLMLSLKVIS